ncbi:MAG: helix-turn-helix domain-containing protein [Candidatus Dadabacteria bacterium]
MQHVEFFHKDHFEYRYHRKKAKRLLSRFIDFFWETDFDELYKQYPEGFSDALFPNVGYTYLINLGTPFVMQLGDEKFEMKSDGFLPRDKKMICHHSTGNKIFGIKFNVSPIIFEKKINFSEYKEYIFPLSYLIDRNIIAQIKSASGFNERVAIATAYYEGIIHKYEGSMKQVKVVTEILHENIENGRFNFSIEELSRKYSISSRTLQRYFEATTSISTKNALQLLRIRKAIECLVNNPADFHYATFGYYDYSHFYKHVREFIGSHSIAIIQPHLKLLKLRSEAPKYFK